MLESSTAHGSLPNNNSLPADVNVNQELHQRGALETSHRKSYSGAATLMKMNWILMLILILIFMAMYSCPHFLISSFFSFSLLAHLPLHSYLFYFASLLYLLFSVLYWNYHSFSVFIDIFHFNSNDHFILSAIKMRLHCLWWVVLCVVCYCFSLEIRVRIR